MMKKVRLENIVFLQGDSALQLEQDLESAGLTDIEDNIFDYLLQWYYPGEHDTNIYNAEDINTPFLGYERKLGQDTFLLSVNRGLPYYGLSRIIEIFED